MGPQHHAPNVLLSPASAECLGGASRFGWHDMCWWGGAPSGHTRSSPFAGNSKQLHQKVPASCWLAFLEEQRRPLHAADPLRPAHRCRSPSLERESCPHSAGAVLADTTC